MNLHLSDIDHTVIVRAVQENINYKLAEGQEPTTTDKEREELLNRIRFLFDLLDRIIV